MTEFSIEAFEDSGRDSMNEESLLDAWFSLEFGVQRSARYHNRRRRFFEGLHRTTSALAVLFGSATLTSIFAKLPEGYTVAMALGVTALGSIDLVVGFASSAWAHADLARGFIDLEAQMLGAPRTEAELHRFKAARLAIERDEPPVLHVLNVICHNDLARAMGLPQIEMAHLSWMQRALAHFFDIGMHRVKGRSEPEATG